MGELFNVYIFFPDGIYHKETGNVNAEEAIRVAKSFTTRPAGRAGIISKIIITDSGDCTVFEWQYGKGVVFPKGAQV